MDLNRVVDDAWMLVQSAGDKGITIKALFEQQSIDNSIPSLSDADKSKIWRVLLARGDLLLGDEYFDEHAEVDEDIMEQLKESHITLEYVLGAGDMGDWRMKARGSSESPPQGELPGVSGQNGGPSSQQVAGPSHQDEVEDSTEVQLPISPRRSRGGVTKKIRGGSLGGQRQSRKSQGSLQSTNKKPPRTHGLAQHGPQSSSTIITQSSLPPHAGSQAAPELLTSPPSFPQPSTPVGMINVPATLELPQHTTISVPSGAASKTKSYPKKTPAKRTQQGKAASAREPVEPSPEPAGVLDSIETEEPTSDTVASISLGAAGTAPAAQSANISTPIPDGIDGVVNTQPKSRRKYKSHMKQVTEISEKEVRQYADKPLRDAGIPRVYIDPPDAERPKERYAATRTYKPSMIAVFKSDALKDLDWLETQRGSYLQAFPEMANTISLLNSGGNEKYLEDVKVEDEPIAPAMRKGKGKKEKQMSVPAHPKNSKSGGLSGFHQNSSSTQYPPILLGALPNSQSIGHPGQPNQWSNPQQAILPSGYFAQPFGMPPPKPPPGMRLKLHGSVQLLPKAASHAHPSPQKPDENGWLNHTPASHELDVRWAAPFSSVQQNALRGLQTSQQSAASPAPNPLNTSVIPQPPSAIQAPSTSYSEPLSSFPFNPFFKSGPLSLASATASYKSPYGGIPPTTSAASASVPILSTPLPPTSPCSRPRTPIQAYTIPDILFVPPGRRMSSPLNSTPTIRRGSTPTAPQARSSSRSQSRRPSPGHLVTAESYATPKSPSDKTKPSVRDFEPPAKRIDKPSIEASGLSNVIQLVSPHPDGAAVRERRAIQLAARAKEASDLQNALQQAEALELPECMSRVAAAYNNCAGNLVISEDRSVVTFTELGDDSSGPPLLTLPKYELRSAIISPGTATSMCLILLCQNDDKIESTYRFNLGPIQDLHGQRAELMRVNINAVVLEVSMVSGRVDDMAPHIELLKKFSCETCPGRWENREGLKYHLNHSQTTCNPNFDPATMFDRRRRKHPNKGGEEGGEEPPTTRPYTHRMRQGGRRPPRPRPRTAKKDVQKPTTLDDERDSGEEKIDEDSIVEDIDVAEDSGDDAHSVTSSAEQDDLFFKAFAFSGYTQKRRRSLSQVSLLNELDVLEDLISKAGEDAKSQAASGIIFVFPGGELENLASEKKKRLQAERIILGFVEENDGYFPGDHALWCAFVPAWNKRYWKSGILPVPALCNNALKSLLESGKLKSTEFSLAHCNDFTRNIITSPSFDLECEAIYTLKANIDKQHPNYYIPEGFSPDDETLHRLQSLCDGTEEQLREPSNPTPRKKRRTALELNKLDLPFQEDENVTFTKRTTAVSRSHPRRQRRPVLERNATNPPFEEVEDAMDVQEDSDEVFQDAEDSKVLKPQDAGNTWYKKTLARSTGLYYRYVVSGAAPLTYMQAPDSTWSFKPVGHGVRPIHPRFAKRVHGKLTPGYQRQLEQGNRTVVISPKHPPPFIPPELPTTFTFLQGDDGTWSVMPPGHGNEPPKKRRGGQAGPRKKSTPLQCEAVFARLPEGPAYMQSLDGSWSQLFSSNDFLQLPASEAEDNFIPNYSLIPPYRPKRPYRRRSLTYVPVKPSPLAILDDSDDPNFVARSSTRIQSAMKEPRPQRRKQVQLDPSDEISVVEATALVDALMADSPTADTSLEDVTSEVPRREPRKPRTYARGDGVKVRYATMTNSKFVKQLDPELFAAYATKRGLQVVPEAALSRKRQRALRYKETNRLITAVIVISTVAGGSNSSTDWILVATLFKDAELTMTWLKKYWKELQEDKPAMVSKLVSDFQKAFIEGYKSGEITPIDFDNVVNYNWSWLVDWAMEKLEFDEKPFMLALPDSRKELMNEYDLTPLDPDVANWRESVYFKTTGGKATTFRRLEHATFVPNIVDAGHRVLPYGNKVNGVSVFLVAKSMVRAIALSPDESLRNSKTNAKLLQVDGGDLTAAGHTLREDGFLKVRPRGRTVLGRKYELTLEHDRQLKNKSFNPRQFIEAANFKRYLDKVLANGKECVRVDFKTNHMCVYNLQAHGRIRVEPVGLPTDPFGGTANKYSSASRGAFKKEQAMFEMDIYPTSSYEYDRENILDIVDEDMDVGPPPTGGEKGEVPIWYDIAGEVLPKMWRRILVAVAGTVASRPGSTAGTLRVAFKPMLEEWEIMRLLEWGEQHGIFERLHASIEGWTTAEWWWLVIGRFCRIAEEDEHEDNGRGDVMALDEVL